MYCTLLNRGLKLKFIEGPQKKDKMSFGCRFNKKWGLSAKSKAVLAELKTKNSIKKLKLIKNDNFSIFRVL